jgi:hypothetical protein
MNLDLQNILNELKFYNWLIKSDIGKHIIYNKLHYTANINDVFHNLPLSLQISIVVEFIYDKYELLLVTKEINTTVKDYHGLIDYQETYIQNYLKTKL